MLHFNGILLTIKTICLFFIPISTIFECLNIIIHNLLNMKKVSFFTLVIALIFSNLSAFSQQQSSAVRNGIYRQALNVDIDSNHTTSKWNKRLVNYTKVHKTEDAFQRIIDKKTEEKLRMSKSKIYKNDFKDSVLAPQISSGFEANDFNGYYPSDNTMAVSKDGIIVSAINTNLCYYDTLGNKLFSSSFEDLINDSTLTSLLFDPKIEYDSKEDRFVVIILHGFIDSTTKVLSMFSKTSNPLDGWYVYYLDGAPINDSAWFDYPNIGISDESIFVSGNIFTENSELIESMVFEIDKNLAYNGDTVNWACWNNFDEQAFNIVPVSYGHKGNYGSQMYFVSSFSWQDTVNMIPYLRVFHLTSTLNDTNPQMSYHSQIMPFSIPGHGLQLGSNDLISINDMRIFDAIYLNGYIHFVYPSEYTNTYCGINYNRLNVNTYNNWHSIYGYDGFTCAFPSLASFTTDSTDKTVMITFLRSGATIYPETRAVICDDSGNWSASSLIKEGESHVSGHSSGLARWGDYSETVRIHDSPSPKVWTHSCFGDVYTNGAYTIYYLNNWISKIDGMVISSINENQQSEIETNVYPNPVLDMYNIEFEIKTTSKVEIKIIDVNGKLVKILYSDNARAGKNVLSFNKGALESGTYFILLKTESGKQISKKLIVN